MIEDFILVSSAQSPLSIKNFFSKGNIIDYSELKDQPSPKEWSLVSHEYSLFLVFKNVVELLEKDTKGVLIDLNIQHDSLTTNSAVDFAIYLRLQAIDLPIFIIDKNHPFSDQDITIPLKSYNALFGLKVAKFCTVEQAFDTKRSLDGNYPIYEINSDKFNLKHFVDNYSISQPDNRHQVTNEWGAVKLANNAGYSMEDIDYNFPETLYFLYLQRKYKSLELSPEDRREIIDDLKIDNLDSRKINLSRHLKKRKILLIDDNAKRGWAATLEKIFDSPVTSCETFLEVGKISPYEYDIVFFDLYMPNPKLENKIDSDLSKKLLKDIKIKYPDLPVIVFTASNKSWTLDEVTQLGADGMYVKESPEYAGDKDYSKGNLRSFLQTTVHVLNKYDVLAPYWQGITKIITDESYLSIQEKGATTFKERIKERLEMFYGLLKRGFEQTKYNEDRFHFSDYVLSFMTLWSILNEIVEINYVKLERNPVPRIILPDGIKSNQDGTRFYPPFDDCWIIHSQNEDKLFEHEWQIQKDKNGNYVEFKKGKYRLIYKVISNISFDKEKRNGKFYELAENNFKPDKSLASQIAFLILKKADLKMNPNVQKYLNDLGSLSETRNSLYLTHGAEVSDGFYNELERDKRDLEDITPSKKIRILYELIHFLLTGEDYKISL